MRALPYLVFASAAAIDQIHIAYTPQPGVLSVDFVSVDGKPARAWTSLDNVTWSAPVLATTLYAPSIGYMHQATLNFSGIARGATAFYKLTTGAAMSSELAAMPELENTSPVFAVTPEVARPEVFAVFGDFGSTSVCAEDLSVSAARRDFDAVLCVGDMAYNYEDANSTVGNTFMNIVQNITSFPSSSFFSSSLFFSLPFLPIEGNHERCDGCAAIPELGEDSLHNFTEYRARFRSVALHSNTGSARYYSFERGLTHFVVLTAEVYDGRKPHPADFGFIRQQLAFLKADLAAVDRVRTPWVVALVHKDWNMSPRAYADFTPVLQAAKVDVLFCGHVHHYARYVPYDPTTNETDDACVSADGATYTDARFMTVIVSGAAGCHEGNNPYNKTASYPSYTGVGNYGYGLFTAINATRATWTWKTVKQFGAGPANYSDTLTWVRTASGTPSSEARPLPA